MIIICVSSRSSRFLIPGITAYFLMYVPCILWGYAVAQLVKALLYKSEGRGSIPNGVIGILHWLNPSGRTVAMGLTQPLTEMSTRYINWG
jgi:hypothetical protein